MAPHDVSPAKRTQLAAMAGCDASTARRWLRGAPVRSTTRQRLEEAAPRLGITPPSPSPASPAASAPPLPSEAASGAQGGTAA
jgi:hypothetical protein